MQITDILVLLLLQGLFFVLLAVVLRFFFFRQVQISLARLRALQEEAAVKEAMIRDELARVEKQRDSIIEAANAEAARWKAQVKKEIEEIRSSAETAAFEERAAIVENGHKELARQEEHMRRTAEEGSVDLSVAMVSRLLSAEVLAATDREYVRELFDEFKTMQIDSSMARKDLEAAFVLSARPLDLAEMTAWRAEILSKLNRDIEVLFTVAPEHVCGILVIIDAFVADGTLREKLQKIKTVLTQ